MTSRQDIRIVHLLQVPEVAPVLARWFVEEWTPWYGPEGRGDAETDLAACRSRDTLPLCLVALTMDDAVLGTAALKAESVGSEIGAGPWLAAVLVGKDHQGRGVGTALVEAVEEEAARLASSRSTPRRTRPSAFWSAEDGARSGRPSRSGAQQQSIAGTPVPRPRRSERRSAN